MLGDAVLASSRCWHRPAATRPSACSTSQILQRRLALIGQSPPELGQLQLLRRGAWTLDFGSGQVTERRFAGLVEFPPRGSPVVSHQSQVPAGVGMRTHVGIAAFHLLLGSSEGLGGSRVELQLDAACLQLLGQVRRGRFGHRQCGGLQLGGQVELLPSNGQFDLPESFVDELLLVCGGFRSANRISGQPTKQISVIALEGAGQIDRRTAGQRQIAGGGRQRGGGFERGVSSGIVIERLGSAAQQALSDFCFLLRRGPVRARFGRQSLLSGWPGRRSRGRGSFRQFGRSQFQPTDSVSRVVGDAEVKRLTARLDA